MEVVNNEIELLENKIAERFEILKGRAKSYQKNGGNIKYLEVLFGSESFNDFISRLSAVTTITGSDAELIRKQEEDKVKVEKKLKELEDLQTELQEIEELISEQKDHAVQMKQER